MNALTKEILREALLLNPVEKAELIEQLYQSFETSLDDEVATLQHEFEHTFAELTDTWRKETAIFSSATTIAMHPAYQRIIGMGEKVIPLILRELQKEPDHWFWALSAITGDNPIQPEDAGDIEKMRNAWLEYGKEHGYLA